MLEYVDIFVNAWIWFILFGCWIYANEIQSNM